MVVGAPGTRPMSRGKCGVEVPRRGRSPGCFQQPGYCSVPWADPPSHAGPWTKAPPSTLRTVPQT